MRQKGYFIMALLFALLAAGAVYLYLQQLEQQVKQDIGYAIVPVVKEHIPAHTKITAEMLINKEVPLSQVRSDALQRKDDVSGAMARVPFYPGEPLIREKLVFPGETHGGLAYFITPGKRAMAVAVNEVIAVGNMLLPGDQVDVVAVLEQKGTDANLAYATIFVQDLRVLAVGQSMTAGGQKVQPALTVTLEVSPEEAQKLVLAAERGSIRLLLRGAGDEGRPHQAPFTMNDYVTRVNTSQLLSQGDE
ncbi:MAG: Flp pilus assembly protein CpaB [Bacillota bacterium]